MHLKEELTLGEYYLKDTTYGLWSGAFSVPEMRPPQFFPPEIQFGSKLQIEFFGTPGDRYQFEGTVNMDEWESTGETLANYFGTTWAVHQEITDDQWFFRARSSEEHVLMGRPDNYLFAPGVEYTLNFNFNDVFPEGATFEVQNPPLHDDIFEWNENGMVWFTGLTGDPSVEFDYTINYNGKSHGPVPVKIDLDLMMLVKPPVGPDGMVQVPCLVLGDMHYPTYQFSLENSPQDTCKQPHWHASRTVFPLENPDQGITDPNPFVCGFGTEQETPQAKFAVSREDWQEFLLQHIPPF
jgi:hypothetical protein